MTASDVHFGQDAAALNGCSDADFLRSLRFNRHAPPPLVKCAAAGDVAGFTRRLAQRRCLLRTGGGAKQVAKLAEQRRVLWSASAFTDSQRTVELAQLWESFGRRGKGESRNGRPAAGAVSSNGSARPKSGGRAEIERRLATWLQSAATLPVREFELLILCEMLPAIGRQLAPELRWKLWRTALTAAMGLCTDDGPGTDSDASLDRLLLECGEAPLQAGLLFAGIKSASKLRRAGTEFLGESLSAATDDEGMPRAERVERLPLWLAVFVRARQSAVAFGERPWSDGMRQRLDRFIRVVTPMCRADGRLALSNGNAVPAVAILRAAAEGFGKKSLPLRLLSAMESIPANGRAARGKKATRSHQKQSRKAAGLSSSRNRPAMQSDESRLACLRTDWSPQAAVLVVAHDEASPRLDLSVAGVPLLNGAWTVELSVDGKPAPVAGGWNCTCWFSDRDVDYMELQHKVGRGVVIDRQVLLSREGEFAAFVDCITGAAGKPLTYRSHLPVESGTRITGDGDTRELKCRRPGMTVRCYPLSLPCDPVHGASGRFDESDGRLQLLQSAVGGLIAPVVLDWSRHRRKPDAEWRQLTVAADGRRVPAENAAGYRLRVGPLHLVVYRSLRQTDESRTVLGMHTRHETVIGRFTSEGTIDPLLLVE